MNKKKDGDEKKEYAIGYKRPPVKNRFKKGKSGNPKGRPKGAENKVTNESLVGIIKEEASRSIIVNQGEEKLTITMTRATVRSLFQKSVKGDVRAMKLFFEMVEKAEKEQAVIDQSNPALRPVYRFGWFLPDKTWISDEEKKTIMALREKNGDDSGKL